MVYTTRVFKSGKAIKEAFAAGEPIEVFQPDPMNLFGTARPISIDGGYQGLGRDVPDGDEVIEGPHYPLPHKFYVGVVVRDGVVVKIKK